ncbi:MAG: glycosyltransferase family 4 protein [Armatimonadota bacterium]
MKILFIHQFFTKEDEPGESRHIELMRYLTDKGFSFDIIGGALNYLTGKRFNGFNGVWQKSGLNVKNSSLGRVYVPESYKKGFSGRISCYISYLILSVLYSFKIKKPDLVLTTSPSLFTALAGYIISRIKRVPFILEIRDLWPKVAVEMGLLKNRAVIRLSYMLEKFLCRKADKIIVITEGYADYVESLGIDPGKISIVPNGIDASMLDFEAKEIPPDIKKYKDKFIVMYAGAVSRFNFLEKMVIAAEKLKDSEDIFFVIVGDGNRKDDLGRMIEEKKLKNIIMTGFKRKDEIPLYLSNADICVNFYPFIDTAGLILQNKVLDFMAMGKPVLIQTPQGITAGIIERSGCGFVLPDDAGFLVEKIKWCRDNRSICDQFGINGKNYIRKNFLRENLAKDFADALKI